MQLEHRFSVPAPIDVAWEALNDVAGVGSCFPGATVTSVDGDEFAGTCKVKLGPISMQYSGSGRFMERDGDAHRAVIEAKGKDRRGNGTAAVTITTSLTPESPERTAVAVDTELQITGKPAQFGRGVIQDVSDKLLGQFAECLESRIGASEEQVAAEEAAPVTVPESGATAEAQPAPSADQPAVSPDQPPPTPPPPPRPPTVAPQPSPSRAPEPPSQPSALDLGATVLPVLAKRYAPPTVAALAVLLLLWRILRR